MPRRVPPGAEQYAATEFAAATAALAQANEAVAARDYRLALNHALESREQGEAAARTAAETRARMRGDTERSLAHASLLLSQAKERLLAATAERGPRRPRLADVSKALGLLEADVQRAGAAVKSEDYAAAQSLLDGLEARLNDGHGAARHATGIAVFTTSALVGGTKNPPPQRISRMRVSLRRSTDPIHWPSSITSAHPVRKTPSASHSTR